MFVLNDFIMLGLMFFYTQYTYYELGGKKDVGRIKIRCGFSDLMINMVWLSLYIFFSWCSCIHPSTGTVSLLRANTPSNRE